MKHIQSWIDAVSYGASVALTECLRANKPIGFASLSANDHQRCAVVLVVLGEDLCDRIVDDICENHGATVVSKSFIES